MPAAPGKRSSTKARATAGRTAQPAERKRTFIEESRRHQILDAALALFGRQGYDATSLSDIATALEVSKGVISYHFEGKAELGAEALRHMLRRYGDYVRQRLEAQGTVRDKLIELPAACIDYVRKSPSDYLVYLDTLGSFGNRIERQKFMAWADAGMRGLICELLQQAQDRKEIPRFPVQPLADILQAAVDGLTEQASVTPDLVDLDASKRMLQHLLAAIFDGRVELPRR